MDFSAEFFKMRVGHELWVRLSRQHCQKDPIMGVIIRLLQDLGKESLERFAANIRIAPISCSPPLTAPSNPRVKFYSFDEVLPVPSTQRAVPISLSAAADPTKVRTEDILVRSGGQWVPIERWLRRLSRPEHYDRLMYQWRGMGILLKWWAANGKHFRLADLPLELRLMIFTYVLGPVVYPERRLTITEDGSEQEVLGLSMNRNPGPPTQHICYLPDDLKGPNMNVLLVSKQVRAEALKAAWEDTWQCPPEPEDVHSAAALQHTVPFNCLKRVLLCMSHRQYMRLFGMRVNRAFDLVREPQWDYGEAFKRMPQLQVLEIRFQNPNSRPYMDSWWHIPLLEPYFACSKILTDWILACGKQYIEHVPVKITGAVKHSIKNRWDLVFKNERRGKHWDETEYIDKILSIDPRLIPLRCSCTNSCGAPAPSLLRSRVDGVFFDFEHSDSNPEVWNMDFPLGWIA